MQLAGFQPASAIYQTVAAVDAHGDPFPISAQGILQQLRIFHGARSQDHAVDAVFQIAFDLRHGADAAADLHGNIERMRRLQDDLMVDALALLRSVQIDQMDVFCAALLKVLGQLHHAGADDLFLRIVPLIQTDRFSVYDIDGRQDDHAFPSSHSAANFLSMFRPSSPLFSG